MNQEKSFNKKLFSYGTLQLESVQISTYGRVISGVSDRLSGYRFSKLKITNPDVIEKSGIAEHPVVVFTGHKKDSVEGKVLDISVEELKLTDKYEAADYKRIQVSLDSGTKAWVYVRK